MNFLKPIICYQLLFAVLLFTVASCKTKKILPQPDNSALERGNAEKLAAIKQAQVDFDTFSIKAKAELNLDGNSNEVNINIRMQESIYLKKPFSFIHEYTNPQINFQTVEAILLANPIAEAMVQKPEFSMQNEQLTLSGISSSLAYQFQFNDILRVSSTLLKDTLNAQQLEVKYSDFYMEASSLVPHVLKLQSQAGSKSIKAEMRYSKIEKDISIDFPFSVPKRFSVKR